jgi:FAD/FMN-containing dehydrogenase
MERDYVAEMEKIWSRYPSDLYGAHAIRQHVGWLKMFVAEMTAENWKDMRARCERQLAELSKATESL